MKHSVFAEGRWYKGNLHTHSTVSDGTQTPEERARIYQQHGYSFLALTDHNVFASYPELCTPDFLILPGTERDALNKYENYFCLHAVGISEKSVPEKVEQQLPRYSALDPNKPWQELIDEMREAGQMVILAHPLWSRNTPEQFEKLDGYVGIEVYNHLCEVDSHTGRADYFIDCCLRAGRKVLLFAQDDCHSISSINNRQDTFGGWIQVKAPELTHEALIRSIKAGSFYASTGPEIYDFGIDDQGKVYIDCSPCEQIHFVAYRYRAPSVLGSGLTHAEYQAPEGQYYVRCECVDRGGRTAYTNPIYLNR